MPGGWTSECGGSTIFAAAAVVENFDCSNDEVPRLTAATDAAVESPCQAADGVPSQVAFFTEVTGLVAVRAPDSHIATHREDHRRWR